MRVHFPFIVTISVALLFISGTTGCRSNGGPWYNPSTYSLANPFDKKEKPSNAPIFGEASPNPKPSLEGIPNVGSPPGGYTDAASLAATRTGSTAGTVSSSPPEHWAQHNQAASQSSPGLYGSGYSNVAAAPSQYSPIETYGGQSAPSSPYQYPSHSIAGASQYPVMPYGDATPPGYQMTSAASSNNNVYPPQTNGIVDHSGGNYSPYGVTQQYDPSYAVQQQSAAAAAMPQGYSYGEAVPSNPYQGYPQQPQGYPGDGVSVAQPYQQPPGGGYNYSY